MVRVGHTPELPNSNVGVQVRTCLLLDVHLDVGFGDFHTIDIAGGVCCDSFRRCGCRTWVTAPGIWNKGGRLAVARASDPDADRKSTRLNSSHVAISYAVFCLKKKTQ